MFELIAIASGIVLLTIAAGILWITSDRYMHN